MKKFRAILSLLVAAVLLVGLVACGGSSSSAAASTAADTAASEATGSAPGSTGDGESADAGAPIPSGEKLVVGVQPTSFCYPVIYSLEKGYFEDAGLDIEYIIFENGSSLNEGLAAGQLDVGVSGLAVIYPVCNGTTVMFAESEKVATGGVYARPDSDIVAASEIEGMMGSAETLKGKTILGATSTNNQLQAYAYMSQFGLEPGVDFEFLNMDYSTANQAFIAGEGDLISADGLNYTSQLEEAGMVKVADYAAATGTSFCSGIIARTDIYESRQDDLVLFLQTFYKASEELMADRPTFLEGYLAYVLENGREYTEETATEELDVRPLFTVETVSDPAYKLGESSIYVSKFFGEIGMIEEESLENLNTNIDTTVLNRAFGLELTPAKYEA